MLIKNALKKLILLVLAFWINISFAQKNNFFISKTEPRWLQKVKTVDKRPAARDIQDGWYLFLYEQQTNIETSEEYEHDIREIISDTGVQNGSEISVTFDPSYQKLVFHKIIIWRDNKPIDKLNASNFKIIQNEKELNKFIYSGTFNAYLILDDVRKGDRIDFSYTIIGKNPVFDSRYSNIIYFEGGSQISNVYASLLFNKKRDIQLKNFNFVPPLKTTETGDLKIYQWQSQVSKTFTSYDYEPDWYNPYGRVQISEYHSWKDIVDWSVRLNTYDLKSSVILNAKVKELKTKSNNNPEQYLQLATRFVQDEIRYMGVEMGQYSHRPNSPEKVLRQRYGDCKDKSLLLVYLLKNMGVQAYPVYINTYLKNKTKERLPSTGAFDHVVVLVEFKNKKIWIDATMSDQRGPITENYFPYSASVLVIKPGNDKLEEVKSNPKGKIDATSIFNVPDTILGKKATLQIKTVYIHNCADQIRADLNSDGTDKLEKDYLSYYSKLYPGIQTVKNITVKDDETNNIVYLTENYEIDNIWVRDDSLSNRFDIYFYGDLISNDLRKLKKSRDVPMDLVYPCNINQKLKIIFPDNWDLKDNKFSVDRPSYKFNYTQKSESDTLTINYNYQNLTDEISGADTKQYIKDRSNIMDKLSYSLYWGNDYETENESDLNYWMVTLCVFVFIIMMGVCVFIYTRKRPFDLEEIKDAPKIGGWLIVAGIGIVVLPFTSLFTIIKAETFSQTVWDNLDRYDRFTTFIYQLCLLMEAALNMCMIAFSILVIFLFFNRRKIFTKYYIGLKIAAIIVAILDFAFLFAMGNHIGNQLFTASDATALIRKIIIYSLWIAYFIKSTRVKSTFVFTYPASAWRTAVIKDINENFRINNLKIEEAIPDKLERIDIKENERF
ncbi:hypothetical protein ASU31_14710 [Pedobacter ginsenosidimutans]|uniref:DUF3857 domain-containing protein n=1 Tax=Pedobacter ginsenosidimutans TaxID=687842 RepID=A0A0T5VN50_9SPHI|nr:DUF3857 domain-containing protein [Pedobacter ginsenosidimutans]KRT15282.1 hypothetical protein ASU31_14710 [Pedobacter ginsenosidimutans]